MVIMGRIYTRSGDRGTTGLHGGNRVSKTDIRIETNGIIDELNVAVGAVRTELSEDHKWQPLLHNIQINLMNSMSVIATPRHLRNINPNSLSLTLVKDLEQEIDAINDEYGRPEGFILPGGSKESVFLHQARVLTRKAERRLWLLNEQEELPELILQYFNRLSDLFFIMARSVLLQGGNREEIWQRFGYKRDKK